MFLKDIINPVNITNHDPDTERYSTTINVPEDEMDYYFAVTAVDRTGNENLSVENVMGQSVDDMAPNPAQITKAEDKAGASGTIHLEWTIPTTNEDGSSIDPKEPISYRIHYDTKSFINILSAESVIETSATSADVTGLVDYDLVDPLSKIQYWFAVTAVDEKRNEQKDVLLYVEGPIISTPT